MTPPLTPTLTPTLTLPYLADHQVALLSGQDHIVERLLEKGASPEFMIQLIGRPPLPAFHPQVLAITFEKTMDQNKVCVCVCVCVCACV